MKYYTIEGIELYQFNELLEELGYYDDIVFNMDELSEIFSGSAEKALQAAFHGVRFGYVSDVFNPYDEYLAFNGYGNFVSIPEYCLQEYFNQFESEILDYVNENEIFLDGVEETEE